MRLRFSNVILLIASAVFLLGLVAPCTLQAQKQPIPLITQAIDETNLVAIGPKVSPLKNVQDLGLADTTQPSGRILLVLKRSEAQQSELKAFLRDVHTPGTDNYHKWLTPADFGRKFGPTDSDIEQVANWLRSKGLTVNNVAKGKGAIEFSGTVGQVGNAFQTEIHNYKLGDEVHHANIGAIKIPAALAPAIAGVASLSDIKFVSYARELGRATFDPKTHKGVPNWTSSTGSLPFYFLTPEDFATQYHVKPVYDAGFDGTGQTIGVVGDSNIDISLVNDYRKLFNLPENPPQVVVDGNDPGQTSSLLEAYLDVENAGAIAPKATVLLYAAGNYGFSGGGGLLMAMMRAVEDNTASVLSVSYGFTLGEAVDPAVNDFMYHLWEQAAAQGQTVLVATGDSGVRIQANSGGRKYYGPGISGMASTPWNVAVGGTDFYFADYASGGASIANYWNNENNANLGSLQKPIPEQPWNTSIYGFNNITYDTPEKQQYYYGVGAASGGASSCVQNTVDDAGNVICQGGWPKPSWQTGYGVPDDGVRDLPDVSLFASDGANGVTWPVAVFAGDAVMVNPDTNQTIISGVGGTSASTPAMAGIMALINQKYGRQGQANFVLYPLASQYPSVFNPVDIGSINIYCMVGTHIGCMDDPAGVDPEGTQFASFQMYDAAPGYDLATGWGTLDVAALFNYWDKISFKSSTTSITVTPTTSTHGETVTITATVTSPDGTPTGGVSIVTDSPLPAQQSQLVLDLGPDGTASADINYLPGGTYSIRGEYGGDGVHGASKSEPVTVTISTEPTVIGMEATFVDWNDYISTNIVKPITGNPSFLYGTPISLKVQPHGANATPDNPGGIATGTVTYTDNGAVLTTIPLNTYGIADYRTDELTIGTLSFEPGAHSIVASYSGDASYEPVSSDAVTFTVTKSHPGFYYYYDWARDRATGNYMTGQNILIEISMANGELWMLGTPPTGDITWQVDDGPSSTAHLNFQAVLNEAMAPIEITNATPGFHQLNVNYPGDQRYYEASIAVPFTVADPSAPTTSTEIALVSPSDISKIDHDTWITMSATVHAAPEATVAPTGGVFFQVNIREMVGPFWLEPIDSHTSKVLTKFHLSQVDMTGKAEFTAWYMGDSVYNSSTSAPLIIENDRSNFMMTAVTPNMVVPAGETRSGSVLLTPVLTPPNGPITISVLAPSGMTVRINPASVELTKDTTVAVEVDAFIWVEGTAATHASAKHHGLFGITAGSLFACMFLMVIPAGRRRSRYVVFGLLSLVLLATAIGCGNNGQSTVTPPPPGPVKQATPKGTYSIVVSGKAANGTIHNAVVNVIVQ